MDEDFNLKFRKVRKKFVHYVLIKSSVRLQNAEQLKKFTNDKGKILPRRATGACAKHQRDITLAIKRARQIAVLPYTQE